MKDYWIVDPVHETVEELLREDQTFQRLDVFTKKDTINGTRFGDFKCHLSNIFR